MRDQLHSENRKTYKHYGELHIAETPSKLAYSFTTLMTVVVEPFISTITIGCIGSI